MSGKLIILSAPSGSGKSTIINHLLTQDFDLEFSISATSRKIRGEEVDGKDYYYLSADNFKKKIEAGKFLEYEEVYTNTFYGTLKDEVERIRDKGNNVIFDVDIVGGLNIKKYYGDDAIALFIQPPSVEALRERLESRGTDSQENIDERVAKAEHELSFAHQFDKVIINDILKDALKETANTLNLFLKA